MGNSSSAPPRWARPLAAVLVVAFVGLAALAVAFFGRWNSARAADADRNGAMAAARQEAVNFVSVDAAHPKQSVQRVLDGATAQFKQEYAKGKDQVITLITQNKVQSTGQVLEAGVVSSDSGHATVLLVVDSTVKNSAQPTGQVRHYRIQMQMTHEHGAWKTSALEFVG